MEKEHKRKPLFDENKIPKKVNGVELDAETRTDLAFGGYSKLIRNMDVGDGTVRDGKLKLVPDGAGEFTFAVQWKKEQLIIEDVIHGHKLTQQEKEDLDKNKTIGPLKLKDPSPEEFFLKVDRELNEVTVNTAEGIGVPEKIGNYELTDKDKNLLANRERMPARVFETDEGFFMANVRLSKDGKGLTYSNIKDLQPEEAKELMATVNVDKTNTVSKVLAATGEAVKSQEIDQGIQSGHKKDATVSKTVSATKEAAGHEADKASDKQIPQITPDNSEVSNNVGAKETGPENSSNVTRDAAEKNKDQIQEVKPSGSLSADQMAFEEKALKSIVTAMEVDSRGYQPPLIGPTDHAETNKLIGDVNAKGSDANRHFVADVVKSELGSKTQAAAIVAVAQIEQNRVPQLRSNRKTFPVMTDKALSTLILQSNLTKTQQKVMLKALNIKAELTKSNNKTKPDREKTQTKVKKNERLKSRKKPNHSVTK